MNKKKLWALAACAVLACSAFAGCRTRTGNKKEPPVTADTLQIAVIAKGYGADYAKELARVYSRKTGKDARVVNETPEGSYIDNTMSAGPRNNKIDLYFALENNVFSLLAAGGNAIDGWDDLAWADLSDVYNSPAEGYKESEGNPDLKIKDIFDEYSFNASTYNGKQYLVPWASGVMGMMYNKTLWDSVNANPNLVIKMELPKTTKEMFALFDKIKSMNNSIKGGAYAYGYSGAVDYTEMLFLSWWPQYEGREALEKFSEGKDINGVYTANIFNTEGRLQAFKAASEVLKRGNGYSDPITIGKDFTQAQIDFLQGKAFFSANGDWLESEASASFKPGQADVGFIKVPVLSSLVKKLTSFNQFTGDGEIKGGTDQKDQKLREMLDWIDGGKTGDAPWTISPADLKFLEEARAFNNSGGTQYPVLVPAYSAHTAEAKDFIKFMLSKEGQEIVMSAAYGTMAPVKVDVTQFDYYNPDPIGDKDPLRSTFMTNTKLQLFQSSIPVSKYSPRYPMEYLGTVTMIRGLPDTLEAAFGVSTNALTPEQYRQNEYNHYSSLWAQKMGQAGVSN